MNKEIAVLSNFNQPWIPMLALIIFVVCFIIYTYWTMKKSNLKYYEQAAMIPLNDEPSNAEISNLPIGGKENE